MSTINLVFAGLSLTFAALSVIMFVLSRRAARDSWDDYDDGYAYEDDELYDVDDERDAEPPRTRTATPATASPRLPRGAEAALWAITETVPNPRNHVILKDPTSEVRLAPIDTSTAAPASPARATEPEPVGATTERRGAGAIGTPDPRTGEYFFAGEAELNRF